MTPALTPSEKDLFVVLKAFLASILPIGIEIVKGLENRIPEPIGTDFVIMTPLSQTRLSTNIHIYDDQYPIGPSTQSIADPADIVVQIDVHGPNSANNSRLISTLFRDAYCYDFFRKKTNFYTPLYHGAPMMVPYHNGEQQIEVRYCIDLHISSTQTVTIDQQFADELIATVISPGGEQVEGIISVDATYPP